MVDLNTTVKRSNDFFAEYYASLGGEAFFNTDDAVHGAELWRTDGSGAILLKDICPGTCGAIPRRITRAGSRILFFAEDGEHGLELWGTDGTPAGTSLVKDIWPGVESGANGTWMLEAGGTIFFPANDGLLGQELWKSDGTAAGTVLVADLRPGAEGSIPAPHVAAGGTVLLDADDGVHGREPWLTDGTAAGTRLLADVNPGTAGSIDQFSQPDKAWLATSGGRFLFVADDGPHGRELWASDGTEPGTILVRDFRTGTASGLPSQLTELAGTIYLAASSEAFGSELWRTDGTPAGTSIVKDIVPGSAGSVPQELTVFAGRLVFRATDATHGAELWTSDGTEAGTALVKDISTTSAGEPRGFAVVAGQLLFFADQGTDGLELWRSDGTGAGTVMVTDFGGQAFPAIPSGDVNILATESRLYFRAFDLGGDSDLWASDGTAPGTVLVLNGRRLTSSIFVAPWSGQVRHPSGWGTLGQKMIFEANHGTGSNHHAWVSDGTPAGTLMIAENQVGLTWTSFHNLTLLGSGALFSTGDLWKTDGTPAGTSFVIGGGTVSVPTGLIRMGGTVLFAASDSAAGQELWKTDGTAAGTARVKDILPGASGSDPRRLTAVGARIYFKANSGPGNQELWTSDGTAAGTVLVEDIRPGAAPSELDHLTAVAGRLFFTANDGASGREPWVSDGTAAGTFRVKDIVPGTGSSLGPPPNVATLSDLDPRMMSAALGSTFFFLADDGSGEELWASDGTEAGTQRVKDIRPGSLGSQPRWLTVVEGRLFFSADDGTHGRELWLSDGTEAGTILVADLLPGTGSSLPRELVAVGETLVFSATDGVHGVEPWASDGSWTRMLGDLAPGALPSSPTRFAATAGGSDKIFFAANDGTTGFELWSATMASPLDFYTVLPCRVVDTRPSSPLLNGQRRTFPVAGTCGVPAEARAVAVNVTAVTPSGSGNLVAWPAGSPKPNTSNLNYSPGLNRSNNSIVELGSGGQIDVEGQTFGDNGQVHFLLDVVGYFR